MSKTVAQTIKDLTSNHLNKNNGVILGQCLSAVGWVQNTIPPQKKGIIELQMTDVAGAGYAVGCALAGAKPIFVIRFQSFLWLNSSPLVMHAAKTKEIRSIAKSVASLDALLSLAKTSLENNFVKPSLIYIKDANKGNSTHCLLYTYPSQRD